MSSKSVERCDRVRKYYPHLTIVFVVQVDPLGPLLTLHDILFSDGSIEDLRNFITKYWYSVILAAVAVIALMVRIMKDNEG